VLEGIGLIAKKHKNRIVWQGDASAEDKDISLNAINLENTELDEEEAAIDF
jgi:hypothetical protein